MVCLDQFKGTVIYYVRELGIFFENRKNFVGSLSGAKGTRNHCWPTHDFCIIALLFGPLHCGWDLWFSLRLFVRFSVRSYVWGRSQNPLTGIFFCRKNVTEDIFGFCSKYLVWPVLARFRSKDGLFYPKKGTF